MMTEKKETALATTESVAPVPPEEKQVSELSQNEVDVIRATYAKDATDAEFNVYMAVCRHRNLNPFKGEVHFIKYGGQMAVVVGIYGLYKIAERAGMYAGRTPYQWCGKDGRWVDVWTKDENPYAARVGIYRKDSNIPVYGIAYWKECAKYYQPKDKKGNPIGEPKLTAMWESQPIRMLAKCSGANGVREACPDVDGIYIAEEFGTTIGHLQRNPGGFNENQGPPAPTSGDDIVGFGKHAEKAYKDLPGGYLDWVEANMDAGDRKDRVMAEKARRAAPPDLSPDIQDAEFTNGDNESLWDRIEVLEGEITQVALDNIQKMICKKHKLEAINKNAPSDALREYQAILTNSAGGE